MQNLLHNPLFRSSVRFGVTVLVVDLVLLSVFGNSPAALLGSFAVAIHLYFLDFDGSFRERLIGQSAATAVGAVAVVLGVLCAEQLWLAVVATLFVSAAFAYSRLLRGYIAQSAVGLQGAFFLPLMLPAKFSEAPELLAGWLIGSAISIAASLFFLPHRRTGMVRKLLAQWLRAAADICEAVVDGRSIPASVATLQARRDDLLSFVASSFSQPGAISKRQRALSDMVAAARWSMPLAQRLTALKADDPTHLAEQSAAGFIAAADLLETGNTASMPNLAQARAEDLIQLAEQKPDVLQSHYSVRLLSIAAMTQLYRVASSLGKNAPVPDVGNFEPNKPIVVLRQNFRWNSVWLINALRTGMGTATCVLIVRLMGLDHGVWVILAALAVTQITLSGVAGTKSMFKLVLGAAGGVVLAGILALLHLPFLVFLCSLPFIAFFAKFASGKGILWAQLTYTPFALANFAVLSWPPHKDIELVRLENIAIGAVVAAGFTIMIFPSGVSRLITKLQGLALRSSEKLLDESIQTIHTGVPLTPRHREHTLTLINEFETAVDAAYLGNKSPRPELLTQELAMARSRDFLLGADACVEIAQLSQKNPDLKPIASQLATWWKAFATAVA